MKYNEFKHTFPGSKCCDQAIRKPEEPNEPLDKLDEYIELLMEGEIDRSSLHRVFSHRRVIIKNQSTLN